METDILIEDAGDRWLWAFALFSEDGERTDIAGGEAESRQMAMELAREARSNWEYRNCN